MAQTIKKKKKICLNAGYSGSIPGLGLYLEIGPKGVIKGRAKRSN